MTEGEIGEFSLGSSFRSVRGGNAALRPVLQSALRADPQDPRLRPGVDAAEGAYSTTATEPGSSTGSAASACTTSGATTRPCARRWRNCWNSRRRAFRSSGCPICPVCWPRRWSGRRRPPRNGSCSSTRARRPSKGPSSWPGRPRGGRGWWPSRTASTASLGSLSVNGSEQQRARFGPLLPDVSLVPFNDLEALERELKREDVALFLAEPVQGQGVILPDPATCPGRRSSVAGTGRCSASMRCRPGSGAPAACSPASTGTCSQT